MQSKTINISNGRINDLLKETIDCNKAKTDYNNLVAQISVKDTNALNFSLQLNSCKNDKNTLEQNYAVCVLDKNTAQELLRSCQSDLNNMAFLRLSCDQNRTICQNDLNICYADKNTLASNLDVLRSDYNMLRADYSVLQIDKNDLQLKISQIDENISTRYAPDLNANDYNRLILDINAILYG